MPPYDRTPGKVKTRVYTIDDIATDKIVEKLRMDHSYPRRSSWKKLNFSSFGISFRLRRFIIRVCIVISVFAAGIVGVFLNSPYTLRIALGSVAMLALLRYRFVLLLAWVLITVVVSSNPIFTGTNFLTGLTVPTLLLMTCMPIKQTFKRMRALAFLLLFFLWMLAGIGISPLGIGAFVTMWIINLDYVAIGILTINTLTTEQRVKGLIDAILCAFAFVALYGIYGYFTRQNGEPDPEVGFRIFSIFGSSPALGLFLSLGIPLALYRTLTLQGFKRIGCLIVMLVLLVTLVMTLDRNSTISVALSLLIMAFFLPSRKMRIALLSSLLALAVLTVLLEQVGKLPPIFYRFFLLQDTTTLNGRTQLWGILLDRFDPTQLLGHGLGASSILLASFNVFNIQAHGQSSLEPHNLFVAILYDHGVIGLTLLILVFITLFVSLIAGLRKTTGTHQMLFLTALAILASVFLQSIGSIDILFKEIGLYFWIIMALPFALYWSGSKQLTETKEGVPDGDEAKIPRMPAKQRKERDQISAV
jgi:O-antigen ligase